MPGTRNGFSNCVNANENVKKNIQSSVRFQSRISISSPLVYN